MSMAAVTLETRQLTKRFGARTALHELTFAAEQAEIIGVLGPNGAGKTTLIRLLTTMLAPTTGSFRVAGVSHQDPAAIRRQVGVLPESIGFPPHQTASEYLRFHGRLFGLSRIDAERTAERLLDEVGLHRRGSSSIATFSRGMRQRLGIARSLVNSPVVIFMDEPTLGLDPAGQRWVLQILGELAAARNTTVVLSTHALAEVEQLCSTVLILDNGRPLAHGTIAEVARAVGGNLTGQLRVPIEHLDRARQALAAVDGVLVSGARSGPLVLTTLAGAAAAEERLNAALLAVLHAQVPVVSFEVSGRRLTDAFLSMTTAGVR